MTIVEKMKDYPVTYAKERLVHTACKLKHQNNVFENIAKQLSEYVRSIPSDWHPELKLRLIYSVITKEVVYDKRERDEENPMRFTYVGCLQRKAVCMGIAEMITILCKAMNIKVITVVGYGGNFADDDKCGPHAWNIVFLPDKHGISTPYHLDATWDLHPYYCKCDFKYYLKTDKYMKDHNHTWLPERYPICEKEADFNIKNLNERLVDLACRYFPKMTPF